MPRIRVTGHLNPEGLDPDFVDLDDPTGLSNDGYAEVAASLGLVDLELALTPFVTSGARTRWKKYESTVFQIVSPTGTVEIRPASPSRDQGHHPDRAGRPVYVIAASNTSGDSWPAKTATAAQAQLRKRLDDAGSEYWEASLGGEPTWSDVEEGVAVFGISEDEAVELGRVFGQEVIFAWEPTSLSVVSCIDHRRSSTGWVSSRDRTSTDMDQAIRTLGLPSAWVTLEQASGAYNGGMASSEARGREHLTAAFSMIRGHLLGQMRPASSQSAIRRAMALSTIQVTGYLSTDDLDPDYVDVQHQTGLTDEGRLGISSDLGLDDLEFKLESQ